MTTVHRIGISLLVVSVCLFAALSPTARAQDAGRACAPIVTDDQMLVSAAQRKAAGERAWPPLTDQQNGFAWPDTPLGVIRRDRSYEFFASDGGLHTGRYGNGKYGSVSRVIGTLNQPIGVSSPIDVIIRENPSPHVNPHYRSYEYIGGGPTYEIAPGLVGAGNLLMVYHAEIPTITTMSFYSLLGLAASRDGGLSWTDLGEIIRVNQPYRPDLDGFDIGDPTLAVSPDGEYLQLYFRDWVANGTTHWENTITLVSVARAPLGAVLKAAFASPSPHAVPFEKYYNGAWQQPGLGGLSSDLNPSAAYSGELQVAYDNALERYVMIIGEGVVVAFSDSVDGLHWTSPVLIRDFRNEPDQPTVYVAPVGVGPDPEVLGKSFYVYYTRYPTTGAGWTGATLNRFTVSCP